jgi:predicted Zn-dependent peptidase
LTTAPPEGVDRSSLTSGLRVVTEQVPGARSVSIGVWLPVGSVDETAAQAGAAHYLEHLLFKGTERRTAAQIAEEIDAVGGELNAFTAKEHTCFYAHVLDRDLPLAVDLLADVVTAATLTPADVELERRVVLEEIAMRDDDPEDLVGDLFDAALFGEHRLGLPVLGPEESIRTLHRDTLHGFWQAHYRPPRMVVAAAGNLAHGRLVELAEATFRADGGAAGGAPRPGGRLAPRGSVALRASDIEQAHTLIGVPTAGRNDPRRYVLGALNTALGGGTSSRLFQRIRERRGLAYSVYSAAAGYADLGSLAVYTACSPDHLDEVVHVVLEVLAELADSGLTAAELARVQGSLRGGLILGLEDPSSRMHRLGRAELDGRQRSVAESLAGIDAVTAEQVAELAAELFSRPLTAAVVGPYKSIDALPAPLRSLDESQPTARP